MPADIAQAKTLISRLRAELALCEARSREIDLKCCALDQAVQAADEGIVVLDAEFNISYANPVMNRLLERSSTDVVGQPILQLVSQCDNDLMAVWRGQCDKGATWYGPMELVAGDGRQVPVRVTVNAVYDMGKVVGYTCVFLDLHDIKEAQRRLTAIRNVIEELSIEMDLDVLGDRALAAAMQLTGADVGVIALLDITGRRFHYRWHCGIPEDFEEIAVLRKWHDLGVGGVSSMALNLGRAQLIPDYQNWDKAWAPFVRLGVRSAVAVPILARDGPVGVLTMSTSQQTNYFSTADVPVVESIARQIGVAVHRQRLVNELRASESRLRGVVEAVPNIIYTASVPDLRFTMVSPAVEKVLGLTPDECIEDPSAWQRYLHEDDRERVGRELREAMREQREFSIEFRVWHKDGVTLRWVLSRGSWRRDGIGRIKELIGTTTDITELKSAQQRLSESENRFRMITTSAKDGIVMMDAEGCISLWNPAAEAMFGHPAADAVGRVAYRLLAPARHQRDYQQILKEFLADDQGRDGGRTLTLTALRRDGTDFPVEVSLSAMHMEGEWYAVAMIRDITERKSMEGRLRQASMVFEHTRDGVIITDLKGCILAVNRAFTEITGFTEPEALGRNPSLLQSGRQSREFYQTMWGAVRKTGAWQGEIWNRRKSGEIYPEWLTISAACDSEGNPKHYVGVFTDITRIKRSEEELERLAHYDSLTDLPNRRLILSRLEHSLEHAGRHGHRVAALYLDIDNFKQINDSLGHQMGDELLVAVARRLQGRLRKEDTYGRLGGDEFFVLLESIPDADEAAVVARDLLALFGDPFLLSNDQSVLVTASIGISIFPEDNATPTDLMRNADVAMYRAKDGGRNQFCFYTSDMNAGAVEKMKLEAELRGALERDELLLYYQPQIETWTGKVVGAEALLRWQRRGHGLVPPDQFIPLAEKTGVILPIGKWVIDSACRQIRDWLDQGLEPVRVAVNVSAKQFKAGDLDKVLDQAMKKYGVAPRHLDVELTESMLMENPDQVVEMLKRLKLIGVKLSLDDFGTGYSSLAYLSRFPLDALKIDKSFIRDIIVETEATVLADSIIALAQRMKLQVVAEGVETAEQLQFLRERDCDEVQGYYFSKPLPAAAFADILRSGILPASPAEQRIVQASGNFYGKK